MPILSYIGGSKMHIKALLPGISLVRMNRRELLGTTAVGFGFLSGCTEIQIADEDVLAEWYYSNNYDPQIDISVPGETNLSLVRQERRVSGQYRYTIPEMAYESGDRFLYGLYLKNNIQNYDYGKLRSLLEQRVDLFNLLNAGSSSEAAQAFTDHIISVTDGINEIVSTISNSEYINNDNSFINWLREFIEISEELGILSVDDLERLQNRVDTIIDNFSNLLEITHLYDPQDTNRVGILNTFDLISNVNKDQVNIQALYELTFPPNIHISPPRNSFKDRVTDFRNALGNIEGSLNLISDLNIWSGNILGPLNKVGAAISTASKLMSETIELLNQPLREAWWEIDRLNDEIYDNYQELDIELDSWINNEYIGPEYEFIYG